MIRILAAAILALILGCAEGQSDRREGTDAAQKSSAQQGTRAETTDQTPDPASRTAQPGLETAMAAPESPMDIADDLFTTTDSGLKYYDIVAGEGDSPKAGQMVTVHYAGWLTDGTRFDNSYDRGKPFTFPLGMGRVIPGWDEGVLTMKEGGKRQLVIPPQLGYGDRGAGGLIPPGATLIFEVECLGMK